jgi:hypothetical protein
MHAILFHETVVGLGYFFQRLTDAIARQAYIMGIREPSRVQGTRDPLQLICFIRMVSTQLVERATEL